MFQLQNMRSHKALKWPIRILFAVVIISFVFFYGWRQDQNKTSKSQSPAKVRSDHWQPWQRWTYIGPNQLKAAQQRVFNFKIQLLPSYVAQMLRRENINPSRLVSPEEAAREAANDILVSRKADQVGIVVSRNEIRDSFNSQPGMTNRIFQQMAQQAGFANPMAFVDQITRDYALDRMRLLESTLAQTSLFELWQEYTLGKETITLKLAAYPVEQFKDLVVISDGDLQKYLDEHREQFRVPDQRRYQYAAFKKNALRQGINPTDEDLKVFYEQNQQDYRQSQALIADEIFAMPQTEDASTTEALAALDAVKAEAAATQDWEALKNKLVEAHPNYRFINRKTAWLELDNRQRSADYMDALVALGEGEVATVGDASDVYLIRKSDERPERIKPFEEVAVQVRNNYIAQQVNEQFEKKYEELSQEIGRYNSVRSFAQAVGLKDELTTMVARTQMNIPGVGSFTKNRDYLKMLGKNQLSDLIKQSDQLVALEVIEEKPEHDPDLAEVRGKVEATLRSERAIDLARQAADDALSLIEGGADFDAALANAPTPPLTTDPFTRTERVQALGAPLIGFAKQTLAISADSTGVSPYGRGGGNIDGYAVWKVLGIETPSKEDFANDRMQFTRDYLQIQRLTIINEWMGDLRHKAQFEIMEPKKQ